ncbi:hypothetical protein HaLaN_23874, partial [Haematococcus lacustris]|jgi:hypothetical protein
MSPQ